MRTHTHTSISCVGLLDARQGTIEDWRFSPTERESDAERWEEVIRRLFDVYVCVDNVRTRETVCHRFRTTVTRSRVVRG